jgi:hypothetical protein
MSTPKLDEYKRLYSEFIDIAVEYHNRHNDYIKKISNDGMTDLNRSMRKLRRLAVDINKAIPEVYREHKNIKVDNRKKPGWRTKINKENNNE